MLDKKATRLDKKATRTTTQQPHYADSAMTRLTHSWDDEQRTRETIDAAGWLHSGDLGIMDGEGYVRVVGIPDASMGEEVRA